MMRTVDWRVQWRPGTRCAERSSTTSSTGTARSTTVTLTPRYEFQMRGIGYGHPQFGHGWWKGESVTGGERLPLPVDDPLAREHVHVQALVRRATVTLPDGTVEDGIGILEQLAIGPHPSGLDGHPRRLRTAHLRGPVHRSFTLAAALTAAAVLVVACSNSTDTAAPAAADDTTAASSSTAAPTTLIPQTTVALTTTTTVAELPTRPGVTTVHLKYGPVRHPARPEQHRLRRRRSPSRR